VRATIVRSMGHSDRKQRQCRDHFIRSLQGMRVDIQR
jgi:hypothetical protein